LSTSVKVQANTPSDQRELGTELVWQLGMCTPILRISMHFNLVIIHSCPSVL